ncbi:MAG: AfsR/SARP family transcriptional regulator [Gemmatimonadales bacterium]
MIELRTLGTVELVRAEADAIRPLVAQPKPLALLVYLALVTPRGFHRRDTLLALLWPDQTATHARASLRQAVHVLRHTLGNKVIVGRGDEELAVDRDHLWCDAVALDDAVARGDYAEGPRLYQAEFLRGFHIREAPEFESWCDGERVRLRHQASLAARALAEEALLDGNAPDAARWARWAAALQPWDEIALRNLVTVLCGMGDRAQALKIYDEFAERLERELRVRPSGATRRFIETVKNSGDFEPAPAGSTY